MCNFFSCIVLKTGEVIWDGGIDTHEDLIKKIGIADNTADKEKLQFARIEIIPPDNNVFEKDLQKWVLRIDEFIKPTWWNKNFEKKCFSVLSKCLELVVIDNQEIEELENRNGLFIRDSKIQTLKHCNIRVMRGSSQVGEMRESSQVGEMWGSSQVGEMRGSSQVGVMWESSQVGEMRESSQVGEMRESSQVREMRGSSQVGEMWGSSQVGEMRGSSQVGEMRESSQVGEMRESSQVREMRGSSQVREMRGSSQVGVMRESSQVGVYSGKSKFKIEEGSNGLVILRDKKDIEIVHAVDKKILLKKYKEE